MKVSKLFSSKYLKKEDFETPRTLTIETVDIETIEGDKQVLEGTLVADLAVER